MRLDAVAAVALTECAQSLQLFCIFHRIQLNLDWRSTHSLRHTHTHTDSTASTLKHSLTHTHTHTLMQGGNVNKMDRVKCVCGPSLCCGVRYLCRIALHWLFCSTAYPLQLPLPLPFPPLPNPPQPHVAALSAARQCCCAKHNLALHTFERLFWRNYITSTQPTAKTRKKLIRPVACTRLQVYPVMGNCY